MKGSMVQDDLYLSLVHDHELTECLARKQCSVS